MEPKDDQTRVLLVEDDSDTRDLLAELLRERFEVRAAASAEEALAALADFDADVVVTDESLPGLSGTGLAKRLRAERPEVTLILVSGFARVDGAELCDHVLPKPVNLEALQAAVTGR